MIQSVRETSELILSHSRKRWLSPTEIFVLLSHEPHETGLVLQTNPILNPKDGQLHIFEEQVFAQHKSTIDNVDWAKKKGQNKKLQETYIKLKIEGKEVISGVYSKAAENDNFRRRSYRLIDKNYSKYCIVHYRLSSDDDRHDQHSVPQSVLHHASKFLPPGTIQIPESMKGKEGAPLKIEQQEEEQDLDWVLDLMTTEPFVRDIPKSNFTADNAFPVPSQLSPHTPTAGPFPPPMLQKIKSMALPVKPDPEEITIVDFSPTNVTTSSIQRKLLICLSAPISDVGLKIGFTNTMGYQIVSGTLLPGGNVIRCSIPGLATGKWILTVLNENIEVATCSEELDIVEPVLSPINILGKRMHSSNPSNSRSLGFGNSSVKFDISGSVNEGYDRQYKIRLVERLTTVRTMMNNSDHSNSNNSFLKGPPSTNNSVTMEAVSSLRESAERAELGNYGELLNISDHELKSVVEEQIVKLVQDLIRRATLQNEIRQEIDALDSAGFNLLHYSCMYNQVALVPILLMRGTKINKKTSTGATSLHLAATAGHFAIVKLLVEHKADVDELDDNGNTASSLANINGHSDISTYLETLSISNVSTSISKMSTSISSSIDTLKIFEETVTSLSLFDKCALIQTDAKSLLSDIDREYLTHSIAMMRPNEIQAMNDEVREIERSDVGTWLMSKHNTYLKELVKIVTEKQEAIAILESDMD